MKFEVCVGRFVVVGVLLFAAALAQAEDKVVPLGPKDAQALEIFGPGVIGKALPAPPLEDLEAYLNLGAGDWHYRIVHGGDEGNKVRVESYSSISGPSGRPSWKRIIGDEYVEYLQVHPTHGLTKYAEDDDDVGYGTKIQPGILAPKGMQPGQTRIVQSELHAFKISDPGKILYEGKSTDHFTYVGAYEVKTPAGTWPAILIKNDLEVKIGPADVTDTTYCFYAKGIGKIAEIELLNVSALFVYHSHEKIAKLLMDWPKH